jgi:hypothetical protein
VSAAFQERVKTYAEAPGEGPADGSALAEFAARVRAHLKAEAVPA